MDHHVTSSETDSNSLHLIDDWVQSCRQQLNTANKKYVGAKLQGIPREFDDTTGSEMALLMMPYSFDDLLNQVIAMTVSTEDFYATLGIGQTGVRRAYDVFHPSQPTWVGFDYGRAISVRSFHYDDLVDLPGPDVFSALILHPGWLQSLTDSQGFIWHSGYQIYIEGYWRDVLCSTSESRTILLVVDQLDNIVFKPRLL